MSSIGIPDCSIDRAPSFSRSGLSSFAALHRLCASDAGHHRTGGFRRHWVLPGLRVRACPPPGRQLGFSNDHTRVRAHPKYRPS